MVKKRADEKAGTYHRKGWDERHNLRSAPPDCARAPCQGQRRCLACGRMFDSEGPWNRICPKCKTKQRHWMSEDEVGRSPLRVLIDRSACSLRELDIICQSATMFEEVSYAAQAEA